MITILVDKAIYRRLSKYVRYICAPTDSKHWVLYSVAIDKWNHIINGIIDSLGNETNGGRICPYPKFSNNGKYRMIQIRDLKTRTTVWDISFEDVLDNSGNIIKRIVHGIELDKVLASIDESVRRITQSDICRIVESAVRKYLNRQILNEKFYNPATEPLIDGHVGEYEVLDGAEWEQILCDLPKKGWVEDIRMYSAMDKGGKTYCLYRRKDNGKYFFVEVFDDNKDDYLRVKQVSKNEVPIPIWNNAISLIRCS